MFSFNNNYYCEYCFEKMSPHSGVCPKCQSVYEAERYPDSLPVGHVLSGKYLVGRVLGQGGFGKTYLCFDMKNSARVAIKEYFPESLAYRAKGDYNVYPRGDGNTYKKGAKKFYKEASLLVRFKDQPEIVRVEKLFMENNTSYFVMEYLIGTDLRKYFNTPRRINENFIIYIAMEVVKGLQVLHKNGVLHRDIAPDNIFMCDNGNIKLIDFGASRMNIGAVSNSLSLVLKPGFAPYEQYQTNGNQGPWTDIYALGATIYYMLKRKVPKESVARINDPSLDMSGISPGLSKIILKMMAVRPQDRYGSVEEILPELIMAQQMNTRSSAPAPAPVSVPAGAGQAKAEQQKTDVKVANVKENTPAVANKEKLPSPAANDKKVPSGPVNDQKIGQADERSRQKSDKLKVIAIAVLVGGAFLFGMIILLLILALI